MTTTLKINSDLIWEGAFWGSCSLINFATWYRSLEKRRTLEGATLSEEVKSRKIWKANKDLFSNTCSAVAGVSMIGSWMAEVRLISLGSFGPILGSMGFSGSALACGVKTYDNLVLLKNQLSVYVQMEQGEKKDTLGLQVFQSMLNVAFFTCVTAWATFSAIYSLTAAPLLFAIADRFFYHAVILFFTNLAGIFFIPPVSKKAYAN
jgi:hypothetical protein